MNGESNRVLARESVHLALGIGDMQVDGDAFDAKFMGNGLATHATRQQLQTFQFPRRQRRLFSGLH